MVQARHNLRKLSLLAGFFTSACTFSYPQADVSQEVGPPTRADESRIAVPKRWRRIEHSSLEGSQTNFFIQGLAPGDGSHPWFASGFVVPPSGQRKPVVWKSTDGIGWERESVEQLSDQDRLFGVARYGDIAVTTGLTPTSGESERSVIWRRASRGTWKAVAGMKGEFGSYPAGGLEGVASTRRGLIAYGALPGRRGTTDGVGVWRSTDGVKWKPESGLAKTHISDQVARAWDVAVHGSITVVVGETTSFASTLDPSPGFRTQADGAIWTEVDGRWTAVDAEAAELNGDGFQQVADVAWFRGRFVAVGRQQEGEQGPPRLALWTSADGLTWSPFESPAFDIPAVSGASLLALEVIDGQLVVAGEADRVPLLWRSPDGLTWRREVLPQQLAFVNDVQAPIALEASGGRLMISVNGTNQAHLWTQEDGRWANVASDPAFPPLGTTLEVTAIAAGQTGYVAVGNEKVGSGSVEGRVWTSSDGRTWTLGEGPFSAAHLGTVAASRRGYVAGGAVWDSGLVRPATWHSTDGRTWRRTLLQARPQAGSVAGVVSSAAGSLLLMNSSTLGGNRITAWISSDDQHWRFMGQVGEVGEVAVGLCASNRGVVAVGARSGANLGETVAWQLHADGRWSTTFQGVPGAPRGCATSSRADVILIDTEITGSQIWHRKPGEKWRQAFINTLGRYRILGLAEHEEGFLAVGSLARSGNEDFLLWTSVDGSGWIGVDEVYHTLVEPGLQRGMALAADGGSAVAGGYFSTGAALWIGPLS